MDAPVRSTDIALDSFHFHEEIRRLISPPPPPPENASSFTALLELPHSRALQLLHSPDPEPSVCPPQPPKVKDEPVAGSDCNPNSPSPPLVEDKAQRPGKRKDRERKGKGNGKKSKTDGSEDAEKLPYVHVRARRGQATDSHSLAERARREKINARMKLLQELVPGCNKISGTALVLDEIINHVQTLQQQVELLSMRLAAVNPQIDFNLDSIFAAESASMADSNFPNMFAPVPWSELHENILREQYQQQSWPLNSFHNAAWGGEDCSQNMMTSDNSHLSYDSPVNSVCMHSKGAEHAVTKVV